jgi:hypothetical protein
MGFFMWRFVTKTQWLRAPLGHFLCFAAGGSCSYGTFYMHNDTCTVQYKIGFTENQAICGTTEITGAKLAPICVKTVLGLFQYVPCHLSLSNERGRIATAKYHKGA